MADVNSRFAVVTEEEILQMLTFLERVALSSSLHMLIQLFSSFSVKGLLRESYSHKRKAPASLIFLKKF